MYAGIRQISVHTVDFRQIPAPAFRADIHLQFLMPAVLAISQGQVHALIKTHIHGTPDQRFDCIQIVINRIFHILYLSAVGKLPETVLQILLLNRGNILRHMAVETVGHIIPVRNPFHNAVHSPELLYLQAAQVLHAAYRKWRTDSRPLPYIH